jgi:hypothetical protein
MPTLILIEKNYGFLRPIKDLKKQSNYQENLSALKTYRQMQEGFYFKNKYFLYRLALETPNFYVFKSRSY